MVFINILYDFFKDFTSLTANSGFNFCIVRPSTGTGRLNTIVQRGPEGSQVEDY